MSSELIIPRFSFFNKPVTNIYPDKTPMDLVEAYCFIKSNTMDVATRTLRSISDKKQAREYKAKNFCYATFSGIFSKRNDKELVSHSGLLTIDFDHIPDLQNLKSKLLADDYFETELLFISPSGDGLKWVIPIDLSKANHLEYFNGVANYIKQTYSLEVDKSGKDVSRACFFPYDKHVYINPK